MFYYPQLENSNSSGDDPPEHNLGPLFGLKEFHGLPVVYDEEMVANFLFIDEENESRLTVVNPNDEFYDFCYIQEDITPESAILIRKFLIELLEIDPMPFLVLMRRANLEEVKFLVHKASLEEGEAVPNLLSVEERVFPCLQVDKDTETLVVMLEAITLSSPVGLVENPYNKDFTENENYYFDLYTKKSKLLSAIRFIWGKFSDTFTDTKIFQDGFLEKFIDPTIKLIRNWDESSAKLDPGDFRNLILSLVSCLETLIKVYEERFFHAVQNVKKFATSLIGRYGRNRTIKARYPPGYHQKLASVEKLVNKYSIR